MMPVVIKLWPPIPSLSLFLFYLSFMPIFISLLTSLTNKTNGSFPPICCSMSNECIIPMFWTNGIFYSFSVFLFSIQFALIRFVIENLTIVYSTDAAATSANCYSFCFRSPTIVTMSYRKQKEMTKMGTH